MIKKSLFIVIFFMVISLSCIGAYGEGIKIVSTNNDKVVIFDDITVKEFTNGNVVSVVGNITIEDDVNGDVVAVAGNITVNAKVTGQVVAVLGQVKLNNGASVDGDVVVIGDILKSDDARIYGQEIEILGQDLRVGAQFFIILRLVTTVVSSILTFIAGIILIAALRKKFEELTQSMELNIGKKIIIGFLIFLGILILSLILFITVFVPLLFYFITTVATIISSIYAGKLILKTINAKSGIYFDFITGLVTLTLVKIILLYLIIPGDFLVNTIIYGLFELLVYSVGIGTLFYGILRKKAADRL